MRGRPSVTSYEYDDAGRVRRTVTSSPWGTEDRALMLALRMYEGTLCPRCGEPKATAWHMDNEGHFAVTAEYVCNPCTAREGHGAEDEVHPVTFVEVTDTRDYAEDPLHGHYTDFAKPAEPTGASIDAVIEEASL